MATPFNYRLAHHALFRLEALSKQALGHSWQTALRARSIAPIAGPSRLRISGIQPPLPQVSNQMASLRIVEGPANTCEGDEAVRQQATYATRGGTRAAHLRSQVQRRIARLYSRSFSPRQLPFSSIAPAPRVSSQGHWPRRQHLLPFFQPSLRHYSTPTGQSHGEADAGSENKSSGSFTGRLKELTRKYGWATVVVYAMLGVVDFGISFFLINLIGAEHVMRAQDYVLDMLVYGSHTPAPVSTEGQTAGEEIPEVEAKGILSFLKGWREKHKISATEGGAASSSLWTTAVLAYTLHKTIWLPVRLGAVAAATPAIVKYLQRFGINIARTPIPESVKQRGAKSLKQGKDRLDKARERHNNWL